VGPGMAAGQGAGRGGRWVGGEIAAVAAAVAPLGCTDTAAAPMLVQGARQAAQQLLEVGVVGVVEAVGRFPPQLLQQREVWGHLVMAACCPMGVQVMRLGLCVATGLTGLTAVSC
jgi:hypothetical protein